jgi:hypothetical protein
MIAPIRPGRQVAGRRRVAISGQNYVVELLAEGVRVRQFRRRKASALVVPFVDLLERASRRADAGDGTFVFELSPAGLSVRRLRTNRVTTINFTDLAVVIRGQLILL